ncbi:MAG: PQQ-binding-like beta-propeller repeat protein [bacterium]
MSKELENKNKMSTSWIKKNLIAIGIPLVFAILASFLLVSWYQKGYAPGFNIFKRDKPASASTNSSSTNGTPTTAPDTPGANKSGLITTFTPGSGKPANLPGAWPRFRGEKFDGISYEDTPLLHSWPAEGPKALWTVDMGDGYAGPAILNGRVYVLDYDNVIKADVLRCLSLANGADIWRRSYPIKIPPNHGMSRTVPAVTDKYAVTIGPMCHVMCVKSDSGEFLWGIDMMKVFDAKVPTWYASQCPLIDDDKAILAPGGKALMIAVDCATGDVLWQTPNPKNWELTHNSIIPVTISGKKVYLYCASGGIIAVDAENGKLLWDYPEWTVKTANVPVPIPIGDGRVFFSGGYDAGCMMAKVSLSGITEIWRKPQDVFGTDQMTPILYDGNIYGTRHGQEFVCLDLDGNIKWQSGSTNRFGQFGGPYMVANGMFFVMDDDGILTLLEANPDKYSQLGRFTAFAKGKDSWGPLAIAGGRLIARDLSRMTCFDVAQR